MAGRISPCAMRVLGFAATSLVAVILLAAKADEGDAVERKVELPASQLDYLPESMDASALSTTRGKTYGYPPVVKKKYRHDEIFYEGADQIWQPYMEFENEYGRVGVSTQGDPVRTKGHPFFTPAKDGNGRACVTCHQPRDGMGLSLDTIQRLWKESNGKAPLFDVWDGANCPDVEQGKPESHSLLLERGLIRIARPWPPRDFAGNPIEPEFDIEVVQDPTGCNRSPKYGLNGENQQISVYRRPRPVANLRYLETPRVDRNAKTMQPMDRDPVTRARSSMSMMADARVTSLRMQNENALHEHMQSTIGWTQEQLDELLEFQRKIHVAAAYSNGAGDLDEPGGPKGLGINSIVTGTSHMSGTDLDTGTFFLMDQWRPGGEKAGKNAAQREFRASVVRGYDLFFLKPFYISETRGITDIRLGSPFKQTCGFCHNTQLTGHDNVPGWMDIGTQNFPETMHADKSHVLPMFKVTCKASARPHPYLGRTIYTRDPGRALVSGKCADVGNVVMQQFRGIAARPPYYINGSAKTLRDMIDFYDRRYKIGYTEQEKTDLVNFFSVL